MKLGENSQVTEMAHLYWYNKVQTFPRLSTIIQKYLPKRHIKWHHCTFAWGCPDTAHNPGVDLLGRLDVTFVSQTSEIQARYKKIKLCCCAVTENFSLLLKFIRHVQPLIWPKIGTLPYFHLCNSLSLLWCSCTSLLQAASRISDMEVHCQKICHEFQFPVYFALYETSKKTLRMLQRIKTGRTANCSHCIKPSVIYYTSKSTILYLYKVLFIAIANSSNYSNSSAGVQFTLKWIVRK